MERYDIGIIGGGPAGYTSAIYYSKQGKSVILFEKDELGGTCLNRGCIPTKALLHIAGLYSELKCSKDYGINFNDLNFDYSKAVDYKNNIVLKLRKGIELALKNNKVTVVKEKAKICAENEIEANNIIYNCDNILLASGSKPKELKGLEFDHEYILSSDDILNLQSLPNSILIVGSGAIGTEWARILSSFGTEVTIIEAQDRLCPVADWEVSKRLERQFKQKKINTYTSTTIESVNNGKVKLSNNVVLEPDKVFVAIGREKVVQDNNFEVPIIGDAAAEVMLAHYAISQAKELVFDINFNKKNVPSVIYGNPEIAWVGAICQSKEEELDYDKSFILLSALGKSHCDNQTDGFIKILSQSGIIKGASIVSPEASSLIQQIAICIENNLKTNDLKRVCFAHPTYSEGIMEALLQ